MAWWSSSEASTASPEAELLAISPIELTHPGDREATKALALKIISGEQESGRQIKRYVHKKGHDVWVDMTTTLVRDAEGKPSYFVTELIEQKRIIGGALKRMLIHSIADDEFMAALTPTSKYNADWDFLIFLRDQGRKCAGDWLAKNFVKLGVESSADIHATYL